MAMVISGWSSCLLKVGDIRGMGIIEEVIPYFPTIKGSMKQF